MKDFYDFSKGFKNPHAERIRKYGYTITIHHESADGGWDEFRKVSPEESESEREKALRNIDEDALSPEEIKALNGYRAANPLSAEIAALEDYRADKAWTP
ncbi:MAG: hypothetical protein LBS62_07675 [Clostridiales bacterium]|jgi:hypothetical protein|nr:hypothetical protein [Clostridiales bacterium]